ncbi:hypothetical protein [Paraglaciecola sp.]|uniref:hypothetical protein n=1 Tax=Paraglaciecola sp. TaxID=1920173 RepID=UPI0032653EA2
MLTNLTFIFCLFKQKAIQALDAKRIRREVLYQSQSLSGIWPVVITGLGITARTCIGRPTSLTTIKTALLDIGNINIQVHRSQDLHNDKRESLISLMTDTINLANTSPLLKYSVITVLLFIYRLKHHLS